MGSGPEVIVAYGYRLGEVEKDALGTPKKGAYIVHTENNIRTEKPPERRTPMLVQLGLHAEDVLYPHPDVTDRPTMEAGAQKRAAAQTPVPDPQLLQEFRGFVRKYLKKHFKKLSPDVDVSYETWRSQISQPEWRKEEYDEAYEKVRFLETEKMSKELIKFLKLSKLGGFGKREQYPQFKHARCINARNDKYKVLVGPIYRAIEKAVFKKPDFIKKIPVDERPQYIMDRLYALGALYGITDFSRFEASFIREVQLACEFELYRYMTSELPEADWFNDLITDCQLGINQIDYRTFILYIMATRMSGEMCTSLGNGFTNNMLLKFIAKKSGVFIVACNEGDDGIFRTTGKLNEALFAQLGFEIKIAYTTELSEASFCGMIFDVDDRVVITDPVKVLANIGWGDARYALARSSKKKALLRLKALSFLYQYPGCPIIQEMSLAILRLTKDLDVRHVAILEKNSYRRGIYLGLLKKFGSGAKHVYKQARPVMTNTRLLMEKRFKVPVEVQLDAEQHFKSMKELQPFDFWWLKDLCHPDCVTYFLEYVRKTRNRELVWPAFNVTRPLMSNKWKMTIPVR